MSLPCISSFFFFFFFFTFPKGDGGRLAVKAKSIGAYMAICLPFLPFKANAIREPDNVQSEKESFTSLRSCTASHLQLKCKQPFLVIVV